MLVDSTTFDRKGELPTWQNTVFRYCQFEGLAIEGEGVDEALLGCRVSDVDWYWGLFNTAVIARTTFERCVFRGTSFRSCHFIECAFDECRFLLDNLLGECTFDDCILAECSFDRCEVVRDSPSGRPVFIKTRWYGCRQSGCTGLDDQF